MKSVEHSDRYNGFQWICHAQMEVIIVLVRAWREHDLWDQNQLFKKLSCWHTSGCTSFPRQPAWWNWISSGTTPVWRSVLKYFNFLSQTGSPRHVMGTDESMFGNNPSERDYFQLKNWNDSSLHEVPYLCVYKPHLDFLVKNLEIITCI
jgi:hypothetical protein